ncbi:MAG: hypothetical protein J0I14_06380 [Propionibacteriaceae bacterium]|jgi:hypothetical protein|nr:hypothetical protein [Propionibacteriaceae bacterium]
MKLVHLVVGTVLARAIPGRQAQRGLSQSTEVALLTGAVVLIVAAIVTAITVFVNARLPRP